MELEELNFRHRHLPLTPIIVVVVVVVVVVVIIIVVIKVFDVVDLLDFFISFGIFIMNFNFFSGTNNLKITTKTKQQTTIIMTK